MQFWETFAAIEPNTTSILAASLLLKSRLFWKIMYISVYSWNFVPVQEIDFEKIKFKVLKFWKFLKKLISLLEKSTLE